MLNVHITNINLTTKYYDKIIILIFTLIFLMYIGIGYHSNGFASPTG